MLKFYILCKNGFTLAEILVTLGIIGVVAAMTIPSLYGSFRARQIVARYKKTVSTLANAAMMANSQYGYDFGGISQRCTANSGSDNPETSRTFCGLLNGTIKGTQFYYGMNSLPSYSMDSKFANSLPSMSSGNRNRIPIYIMPDGSMLILSAEIGMYGCESKETIFYNDKGNTQGTACYGLIDVNGTVLPNKEVQCSVGRNSYHTQNIGNCIVNANDVGDIFPIRIYNNSIEPISSAGWYVLRNFR